MATFTGSYGQPIVMGLTPWTRTRIRPNAVAGQWPPLDDAERLDRYNEYELLVENRAQEVFKRLSAMQPSQAERISIAVALPELLCNVWADSVWSDPPSIELNSSAAEKAWSEVDEANDFTEIRAWERVFAAAMRGTSVVRLFRSEELGEITGDAVQLEEISAGIYFPKLRAGSDRLLDYVVLAWEENRSEGGKEDELWHVRQVHALNDRGNYEIATSERRAKQESFRLVKTEVTDLDFLPFVDLHGLRWSGRYWGMSELARHMPLFDEVNNTLSNLSNVLEYHGDPMLQVPFSALFGGVLAKGSDRTLAIRNSADKDVARYITYDGQLASHLQELDKVLDLLFLTGEIPQGYFGRGVNGELGSGTAMRLALQNYLKKATRWQRREALAVKKIVDFSLRMKGISDEEDRIATVTHGSPLPADDEQEARIETSLVAAGLSSKKLSLLKLRRVPADEVDEELDAIEADKEASVTAAQNAFGGAPPGDVGSGAVPGGNGRQGPPPSRRGGSSASRQS